MRKIPLPGITLVLLAACLLGCTASEQVVLQTKLAELGQTAEVAAATAEKMAPTVGQSAQTKAVEVVETAKVVAPTALEEIKTHSVDALGTAQEAAPTVIEQAKTVVPPLLDAARQRLETQVAEWLATATPAPGGGVRYATAVYTVQPGDTLEKIAARLGATTDVLVQFNQDRYPAIAGQGGKVEPGWVLIIARLQGAAPRILSTPTPGGPTGASPGCDVSAFSFLPAPIQCTMTAIDYISATGSNLSCVGFSNLTGHSKTHTVVSGWYLTDANGGITYGWFYDAAKEDVTVGPAVVVTSIDYLECVK